MKKCEIWVGRFTLKGQAQGDPPIAVLSQSGEGQGVPAVSACKGYPRHNHTISVFRLWQDTEADLMTLLKNSARLLVIENTYN
jgi:hypothetical protein